MRQVALVYGAVLLSASVASTVVSTQTGNPPTQAPTGIDNRTVDTATANQAQHIADEETFAERDGIEDGLGPIFNMPLWGLRFRSQMMHDGSAEAFNEAIDQHEGEADFAQANFQTLSNAQKTQLFAFLKSL